MGAVEHIGATFGTSLQRPTPCFAVKSLYTDVGAIKEKLIAEAEKAKAAQREAEATAAAAAEQVEALKSEQGVATGEQDQLPAHLQLLDGECTVLCCTVSRPFMFVPRSDEHRMEAPRLRSLGGGGAAA